MPEPVDLRGVLRDTLTRLASALQVVRVGPPTVQPGEPVTVSLQPLLSELRITNVANPAVSLVGAITGTIGKQLADGAIGDLQLNLVQEMNPAPLTGSLGTLNSTLQLGQITGTVTETVGKVAAAFTSQSSDAGGLVSLLPLSFEMPVNVDLTWTLQKPASTPDSHVPLGPTEFLALDGLTTPIAAFAFLPELVELTVARPLVVPRFIQAQVTLSVDPKLVPALSRVLGADTITVGPIVLPAVEVLVPVLAIPRVLALFRFRGFEPGSVLNDGFVLVFVPKNSPLRTIAQLAPVMSALDDVLEKLGQLPANPLLPTATALLRLGGLHLGIRQLLGALAQPHVRLVVADKFDKNDTDNPKIDFDFGLGSSGFREGLDAIHMVRREFAGINPLKKDIRGNQFNALMFVGVEGQRVRFWNASNPDRPGGKAGELLITAGPEMFVAVRELNALPSSEPANRVQVIESPRRPDTFAEAISSFRFEAPAVVVQDYSIRLPETLEMVAGSSGPVNVSIRREGGFASQVSLTLQPSNSGITGIMQPSSVPAGATSSVLTVSVAATVRNGSYPITVRGTAGNLTRSDTLTLVVKTFAISLSEPDVILAPGDDRHRSATITVSIARAPSFTGSVALAVEGLPPASQGAGVGASFAPATVPGNIETSTLTLTVGRLAPPAALSLTVRGTSGAIADAATLTVEVLDTGLSAPEP